MKSSVRRSALLAVLTVVAALVPATARAAVTIGQSPPIAGNAAPCNSMGNNADALQLGNATGPSYTIPAGGGVITRWRSTPAAGTAAIRMRVFDVNGSSVTAVGESGFETVTPASTSFPTRVPVDGGEQLGLTFNGTGVNGCTYSGATGSNSAGVFSSSAPIGQSQTLTFVVSERLVNVSATLEPDADRDGFGDETQDCFPADPAMQGACLPPPEPPTCDGKTVTITGTDGVDRIRGTFAKDVIVVLGGDDVVVGRGGNDVICGGDGRDELKGGNGKDKLLGEGSKDKLVGGGQKDTCNGGPGNDINSSCEKGPDS